MKENKDHEDPTVKKKKNETVQKFVGDLVFDVLCQFIYLIFGLCVKRTVFLRKTMNFFITGMNTHCLS